MKKALFLIFGFLISFVSVAQDLNSYKYVIVPEEYNFTKAPDMFQLNSLTKFLFDKYGFQAYMENEELPEDLKTNRCKALFADVENESSIFVTKLVVVLKDCQNKKVFNSEEGRSREKDYKFAYQEALRDAFVSIAALNYNYKLSETIEEKTVIVSAVPSLTEPEQDSIVEVSTIPAVIEKEEASIVEVSAIPNITKKEEDSIVEVSAIPVEPKGIEISVENKSEEKDLGTSEEMTFRMGPGTYSLRKSGNGYNLFQKGMSEPFASLIASNSNDSFIYSSITAQGIANFDEKGNLVVEILNKETNSVEIRLFQKQD
ncbi:hypothetical protein ACKGJN_00625 [Gillisia sp. Q332]|uniref:hypothetical protein n=1 Tax=Gillisia xinjiangensis TaxID=3384765 RepID=UPI00391C614A